MMVQSEVSAAKGRVNIVVNTKDRIFVMEFKIDDSAKSVLEQIRERRYGSAYLQLGQEIIALGINFSSPNKKMTEWQAVSYVTLLVEG